MGYPAVETESGRRQAHNNNNTCTHRDTWIIVLSFVYSCMFINSDYLNEIKSKFVKSICIVYSKAVL